MTGSKAAGVPPALGYIEKIDADGTRTIGRFKNGEFLPGREEEG